MKRYAILASLLLTACASSSHIVIGTVRTAIKPESVKVYLHAPAKYEEVAMLQASSADSWSWTDQGQIDDVMKHFKQEAASLGANGVLLQDVHEQQAGSVGVANASVNGNNATAVGISQGWNEFHGKAIAIFVPAN